MLRYFPLVATKSKFKVCIRYEKENNKIISTLYLLLEYTKLAVLVAYNYS